MGLESDEIAQSHDRWCRSSGRRMERTNAPTNVIGELASTAIATDHVLVPMREAPGWRTRESTLTVTVTILFIRHVH
eukprot:scaffold71790_cov29-Tisochrysis_lutea.AAC.1